MCIYLYLDIVKILIMDLSFTARHHNILGHMEEVSRLKGCLYY